MAVSVDLFLLCYFSSRFICCWMGTRGGFSLLVGSTWIWLWQLSGRQTVVITAIWSPCRIKAFVQNVFIPWAATTASSRTPPTLLQWVNSCAKIFFYFISSPWWQVSHGFTKPPLGPPEYPIYCWWTWDGVIFAKSVSFLKPSASVDWFASGFEFWWECASV